MRALGMIEVRGYLGAVSAADAALKAADVELNSTECISGGLTTIMVVGDVAAVSAAVDAAAEIATRLGCLKGKHVISRVDDMTAELIGGKLGGSSEAETTSSESEAIHSGSEETREICDEDTIENTTEGDVCYTDEADDGERTPTEEVLSVATDDKEAYVKAVEEWLHGKRVVELRKIAYRIRVGGLKRTAIKFANKETLITAILNEVRRGERFELD